MKHLQVDDTEVAKLIQKEALRIDNTLDLIASENHPAPSILEATGSIFSAKTVEGYPGKRFHAGCTHVDDLERLAVARAKKLFGAGHANVQPHTGVAANLAVYFSVLEIGDKVLAMKLDHGGHLSHGHPSSITSKCFDFRHYGVNRDTERIDYDEIEELALKLRPRMIVTGASAYSRLIDYERVAAIAAKISAYTMVDMAHIAGLVAAKVIPGPVPHSDFVTFTMYKTMGGGRGGVILCREKFAQKIDSAIFPGTQGTPHVNSMAAKAVCFKLAMQPSFTETQKTTLANAAGLAREMAKRGYRIVFGGTENHTVLLDLRPKGLTGDIAEAVLESVGIMTNKNVIPHDPEKPLVTSGLRLGTSAISTRGMGPDEVVRMAELMDRALMNRTDKVGLNRVSDDVSLLCSQFPVYV
jgi:glycine hydroxymethyltransferase